tara:strand:+ start:83 stop:490 length:408 start_codon:yes stop_codon:yes gene_type:complete
MKEYKKYKLIKTYPGYEVLGAIAYQSGEYYYILSNSNGILGKQMLKVIEDNPEYWELIIVKNKLLNEYLEATKKPFADIGSMYDVDIAEGCIVIANEFAIGFGEWLSKSDGFIWLIKGTLSLRELLEIYKKEKGL